MIYYKMKDSWNHSKVVNMLLQKMFNYENL